MMYFSSVGEVLTSVWSFTKIYIFTTDIQSDLRGKWENSARSSLSEEATSLLRWEQLKKTLQSKKNKVCNVLNELKTCMLSVANAYLSFTQLLA